MIYNPQLSEETRKVLELEDIQIAAQKMRDNVERELQDFYDLLQRARRDEEQKQEKNTEEGKNDISD